MAFEQREWASFTERNFIRNEKLSISNEEKRQLGELVKDFKAEYDIAVVQNNGEQNMMQSGVNTFWTYQKKIMFPVRFVLFIKI